MKRFLLILAGVMAAGAVAGVAQSHPPGVSPAYAALLRGLYHDDMPTISGAELTQLRKQQPALPLLDTRTPEEFQVSHLRGARRLDPNHFDPAAVADLPRNQPVVVYCSVGARSQNIGEELQKMGFTDVRNLYGGIFQWVNDGRPVYDAQGKTNRVHPYSALWGMWLKRGEKAYQ